MQDLVAMEEQGWKALATVGDAGRRFYAALLREDAVMLFPGGMRIEGRDSILESLGAQPWQSFTIEHARVVPLSPHAATVVYRVSAERDGDPPYAALVSSTYVRDPEWKLVIHQQTPV